MSRTMVLLGRLGDLINALPIFHAESQSTGEPCRVMCCAEYAPLFEGTSYVKCIPFNGTDNELRRAHAEASKESQAVSLQVIGDTATVKDITYGPAGFAEAQTDSFQKEAFWLSKNQELWSKQPRPIFDKRDEQRENAFARRHSAMRSICVAALGKSSPFPYKDLLFELLRNRFPDSVICDLADYKAHRFYDFLNVLGGAHCLVTVDSAFLHLAHACPNLPVCALVNDSPKLWYGSAWRANHISHIRYSDFPLRAVEMLDAIEAIKFPASYFVRDSISTPRLVHVWSAYELSKASNDQHCKAVGTWGTSYSQNCWVACKVEVGALGRDSKTHPKVKDDQRQPFVKDVIRLGCYRARLEDIIVLTRSDTQFSESLSEELLTGSLPAYCHRTYRTENGDTWHPQVDLFAFTKKWWMEHQSEMPNFFFGSDQFWTRTLLAIIKKAGGREIPFAVYRSPSTQKVGGGKRFQWNELLHNEYQSKHGQIVFAKPCAEQLPAVVINRHALDPHAYNGAVIRYKNRLLLAYRYHDQRDLSTALAMAEIDERGNVRGRKPIHLPQVGGSEEDPRLFVHNDDLYLCYVDSSFPAMPPKAVVKYGKLVEDANWKLETIYQPKCGQNDMTACEKNFVFFERP
jgi:hypothetical protein